MKLLIAFFALCAVAFAYVPKLDDRIVGGQDVNIKDYPYQASVRYNERHLCGGSIIDTDTILTAGHCVFGKNYSLYSVRVGDTFNFLGDRHTVSEIRLHENYDPKTADYDMAILKLSSLISFSSNAQPVALQPRGEKVVPGTTAWVSGWGARFQGSTVTTLYLQAVNLTVINNEECSTKYSVAKITPHMMCAQTPGHDSCQGDSGGPLVADGILIGVVSWGYGCAINRFPGVYANVSDLHDWILDNK